MPLHSVNRPSEAAREINPMAPRVEVVNRAYQVLAESSQFHSRRDSFRFTNSNGVLTVRGRVPSFYLKQVLQELLKTIEGVRKIDNQVDVVAHDGLSSVRKEHDELG